MTVSQRSRRIAWTQIRNLEIDNVLIGMVCLYLACSCLGEKSTIVFGLFCLVVAHCYFSKGAESRCRHASTLCPHGYSSVGQNCSSNSFAFAPITDLLVRRGLLRGEDVNAIVALARKIEIEQNDMFQLWSPHCCRLALICYTASFSQVEARAAQREYNHQRQRLLVPWNELAVCLSKLHMSRAYQFQDSTRSAFGIPRGGFDIPRGGFGIPRGGFSFGNNNGGGFSNSGGGFGNTSGGFGNTGGGFGNKTGGGFGNKTGGGFGNKKGGGFGNSGGCSRIKDCSSTSNRSYPHGQDNMTAQKEQLSALPADALDAKEHDDEASLFVSLCCTSGCGFFKAPNSSFCSQCGRQEDDVA